MKTLKPLVEIMRKCPHCDHPVPPGDSRCPKCGHIYWEPEQSNLPEERGQYPEEHEKEGCASLVIWPVLISIAVTAVLILIGFSTHIIGHWADYSFSIFWILLSIFLGAAVFKWLFKKQDRNSKEDS
jgi:hypothetical protein